MPVWQSLVLEWALLLRGVSLIASLCFSWVRGFYCLSSVHLLGTLSLPSSSLPLFLSSSLPLFLSSSLLLSLSSHSISHFHISSRCHRLSCFSSFFCSFFKAAAVAKAEAAARVSRLFFLNIFYFLFFQRPSTERSFFFFILVEMMFEGRSVSSRNAFRRLASSSPPSRGSDGGGR